MTDKEKLKRINNIAEYFKGIMLELNLDLEDPSLKDTPMRVGKAFVNELFRGLIDPTPKLTTFPNDGYNQIVVVKDIELFSTCEHHFLPIVGTASIGYIPNGKVLGLSKFNRSVQHFAAKPQLQERIVKEVSNFLSSELETKDIIVHTDCVHFCSCARGPRDSKSSTVAVYAEGRFRKDMSIKNEFYKLIEK